MSLIRKKKENIIRLFAALVFLSAGFTAVMIINPAPTVRAVAKRGIETADSSGQATAADTLPGSGWTAPADISTAACTTAGAGNITETSVTVTGNITSLGGEYATAVIVRWSDYRIREDNGAFQAAFFSSSENITVAGTYDLGLFSITIPDLIPGLEYWAIVGVRNSAGWGWAENDVSFTMADNITSFCTVDEITDVGTTSANVTGTLISTSLTRAFGNPVIDEDVAYGGWIILGDAKTYAHQNPLQSHTATPNEAVVGYAFRTRSRPTGGTAGAGLYEFEAPNVTSHYGDVTMVTVPNDLDGIQWVYSEAVNIPLVEGVVYCASAGNFTNFWGNKTTGNLTSGSNFVWVMTGAFPDDASANFDHASVNKYNIVAFYTTPADNVTEYGFFWGTTPGAYTDNATGSCNMGAGTIDSHLSGLSPGTTYYAAFGVKNSSGWDYSDETSFTTDGVPVLPVPELSTILLFGGGAALLTCYLLFCERTNGIVS
jgi:hypothetical protein